MGIANISLNIGTMMVASVAIGAGIDYTIHFINRYKDELKKKLWGEHLWNPSYFISTVSENTEEQIRNYIKSQKER